MSDTQTSFTERRTADNGAVDIEIVDVLSGQRAAFNAKTPEEALETATERIAEPLRPWWEPMKDTPWNPFKPESDDPLGYAMMLQIAPLDMDPATANAYLDRFDEARSLDACADAIVKAFDMLKPSTHGITLPAIRYMLALARPSILNERDNNAGYTGIGGNPGQIMMLALPSDYNLPRLAAMAAHEVHHNVRLSHEPWDPATITVGQYIVLEGLAETFAAELYGENSLGPWTLMHDEETLDTHRSTFRDALEQVGDPRPYMFGDWAAEEFHYEKKGLPDYIGYGMGYRVVKSYLETTGLTATETTYMPWREIVAGSPWLHEGR